MIELGSRVAGYTILHILGRGGMGQVYLAQHLRIARRAAIKVLLPELSTNEAVVERFFTEARATSVIRHPGIVEVFDCDMADGQGFIVMEYLEGESLAAYLGRARGPLGDLPFALAVTAQVASAVGAAHHRGIVHRDLKPDNVFLAVFPNDDGTPVPRVKVLDFGIAKLAPQGGGPQTRTGALLGTPAYMSPEQCRGGNRAVDERSDVYSLGCICYEMLCGQPPFVRDGMGDLIVAHVSESPQPVRAIAPGIPSPVEALVMRMLAKDPDQRPASMEAVTSEVTNCLASIGLSGAPTEIRPRRPVIVPALPAQAQTFALQPTPQPGGGSNRPRTPVPAALTPSGGAGGTKLLPDEARAREEERRAARANLTTLRAAAAEAQPLRATRRPALVVGALLGVGGIVAALLVTKPWERQPQGATPGATTPSAAQGAVAPRTEAEERPPPVGPAPSPPEMVAIDLRGLPRGAEVLVDGTLSPARPIVLPRGDRIHVLTMRARGYGERTLEIDATRDRLIDITLVPLPSGDSPLGDDSARRPEARDRTDHHVRPHDKKEKAKPRNGDRNGDERRDREAITDI
jgi:serine/threonine-protein kinase